MNTTDRRWWLGDRDFGPGAPMAPPEPLRVRPVWRPSLASIVIASLTWVILVAVVLVALRIAR